MNVRNWLSLGLFSLVAILSFSVWALGSQFFEKEGTMYAGCALVFFGLGGLSLVPGAGFQGKEIPRFCAGFAVAFLAYAVVWSLAWFTFPHTFGEIVGSALGLLLFALILKKWMRLSLSLLTGTAVLFLFHTLGYYFGGMTYQALQGKGPFGMELSLSAETIRLLARLSWGLFYGVGLSAGLLQFLYLSRQSSASPSTQI